MTKSAERISRDRSQALEKRDDTLGRCIRLMSSVYHPHLKETVGDLMFAVCDEDGNDLYSTA